jgi:lon-related putative ATP-dependent protease
VDAKNLELRPEQLRLKGDPSVFSFKSTAELPPLEAIIGQERAVRSIDFGIDMPNQGYNIYAVGPAGSGRTTTVRRFLSSRAAQRPVPAEWCYVYNFEDPRRPKAISLPSGRATKLRSQMVELVRQLQREIPRAFEGEYYEQRRREIVLDLQQKQQQLLQDLEKYLNERGFALIRAEAGLAIAPMLNGEVLTGEAYEKLDPEMKKKYESFRPELQEQFDKTMRLARELDRQGKQRGGDITHDLAGIVVNPLVDEIKEGFSDCPKVMVYLEAVRNDVMQHATDFIPNPEAEKSPLLMMTRAQAEQWLGHYKVNVLAEAGDGRFAPVVIEDNPTYYNLIGRIEHRAEFGAMVTDFMQIRAGALHRANGGYLVVEAKDMLQSQAAWEALKRALRNREIKIGDVAEFYGPVASATLEPEPIPLDVKVVIIGDERLYQLLHVYDEDYRELFKVKAEFAATMPRDEKATQGYALFVGDLCRREGLRHFDSGATSEILDEAARLADDQHKVVTRFAEVADLVREAAFWAGRAGHELVTTEDVRAAVRERDYRLSQTAERYRETIREGVILIATQGVVAGQVNGLSVIQLANYEFGLPSRITARTFMGRAGVISIDREVKMSGPIHDKGQLILASYLSTRFAQQRTLSMSATLTFEQSYSGVEGDSASSTELYALLSDLSGVPIKQNLAVTGSVNQFGQVQAIGGVNAKIEGFFDVCKDSGLTGDQGVLVPSSNLRHLMLRDEVIRAVAEGKFHIYAVSTIEEGIELLTGVPAGEMNANGGYPEGTIYARVQARLNKYAENLKEEGGEEEEKDPAPDEEEGESAAAEDDAGDPGEEDEL